MYCSKCGNEIKEGALFCTKCGSSVNPAEDPVTDISKTVKWTLQKKLYLISALMLLLAALLAVGGFIIPSSDESGSPVIADSSNPAENDNASELQSEHVDPVTSEETSDPETHDDGKIHLTDYMTIYVLGTEGDGTAYCWFDTERFVTDYKDKIHFDPDYAAEEATDENYKEQCLFEQDFYLRQWKNTVYRKYFYDDMGDTGVFLQSLDGKFSKMGHLSNGETITFTPRIYRTVAPFGITMDDIDLAPISHTVEGLSQEPRVYECFENTSLDYWATKFGNLVSASGPYLDFNDYKEIVANAETHECSLKSYGGFFFNIDEKYGDLYTLNVPVFGFDDPNDVWCSCRISEESPGVESPTNMSINKDYTESLPVIGINSYRLEGHLLLDYGDRNSAPYSVMEMAPVFSNSSDDIEPTINTLIFSRIGATYYPLYQFADKKEDVKFDYGYHEDEDWGLYLENCSLTRSNEYHYEGTFSTQYGDAIKYAKISEYTDNNGSRYSINYGFVLKINDLLVEFTGDYTSSASSYDEALKKVEEESDTIQFYNEDVFNSVFK